MKLELTVDTMLRRKLKAGQTTLDLDQLAFV